ncbi:MAG TPA: AlkA N-terminal domain-containing protein [Pseudomonadales bacterium]|nr:AlkA N-terminal domain-containing protein [Pseudomonadales bacterium]
MDPGTDAAPASLVRALHATAARGGDVGAFAIAAGLTLGALRRACARSFGASPGALLRWRRLATARRLLDDSDASTATVASLTGFSSGASLTRALAAPWPGDAGSLRAARRARATEAAAPLWLHLPAVAPFAGRALDGFFARRTLPGVETAGPGAEGYRRCWRSAVGQGAVVLRADDSGATLRIDGCGDLPLDGLLARSRRLFDLDAPAGEIARLLRRDPHLAAGVRALPGRRVPGCWDPFELSVRAVLGQQVTVAAARTHAIRLVELCGATDLFPEPERLLATDLTPLAMPAARKRALTGLAAAVADGRLDFTAPPAAVRAALLAVPGIGPWTADYVAMRGLGDADAFPAGDLVVRQALAADGVLPSVRDTEVRSHPWRPFRAYAVMHLWASVSTSAGG